VFYGMTQYGGALGFGTVFSVGYRASPYIVNQPFNTSVTHGARVLLQVTAGGGDLHYQWSFNTTPIPDATNATLLLPSVTRTTAGVYCVLVTNSIGSVLSSNALLSVLVPQELFGQKFFAEGLR